MDAQLEERKVCPACTTPAGTTVTKLPYLEDPIRRYLTPWEGRIDWTLFEGAVYELVRCAQCTLLYQRWAPNDPMATLLYDKWLPGPNPEGLRKVALRRRAQFAAEVERWVAFLNRTPENISILDFGSGRGEFAGIAKAFGCHVSGADLADSRTEQTAGTGIEILDLTDLPAEAFDIVNANQVVEHLADPLEAMQRMAAACVPGGYVHIAVPNGWNINRRLKNPDWGPGKEGRRNMTPVQPLQHLNCFTHRSLVTLGKRVGLEPVRVPLKVQYRFIPQLLPAKTLIRNLARPMIYLAPLSTDVVFHKPVPV